MAPIRSRLFFKSRLSLSKSLSIFEKYLYNIFDQLVHYNTTHHPMSAIPNIFSKKPCVSLCLRPLFCIPFFFFSVFLFSGCQFVRCAMLCPPRTAPPPSRPHPPSHRALGPRPRPPPDTLAPGSRWRTGSDRQPTNRRRPVIVRSR